MRGYTRTNQKFRIHWNLFNGWWVVGTYEGPPHRYGWSSNGLSRREGMLITFWAKDYLWRVV